VRGQAAASSAESAMRCREVGVSAAAIVAVVDQRGSITALITVTGDGKMDVERWRVVPEPVFCL
jgi:hypothetical protein